MKFPVLWFSFVSLWVLAGTEKGICLAWDLVSRPRITLHFGAKAAKTSKNMLRSQIIFIFIFFIFIFILLSTNQRARIRLVTVKKLMNQNECLE